MLIRFVFPPTVRTIRARQEFRSIRLLLGKMKFSAQRPTIKLLPSGASHTPTARPKTDSGQRPGAMCHKTVAFSYLLQIGLISWARNPVIVTTIEQMCLLWSFARTGRPYRPKFDLKFLRILMRRVGRV